MILMTMEKFNQWYILIKLYHIVITQIYILIAYKNPYSCHVNFKPCMSYQQVMSTLICKIKKWSNICLITRKTKINSNTQQFIIQFSPFEWQNINFFEKSITKILKRGITLVPKLIAKWIINVISVLKWNEKNPKLWTSNKASTLKSH